MELIYILAIMIRTGNLFTPRMTNWIKKHTAKVIICNLRPEWMVCDRYEGMNFQNISIVVRNENRDILTSEELVNKSISNQIFNGFTRNCEGITACLFNANDELTYENQKILQDYCIMITYECREMNGM
ncbi:hypothetical protein HZS_519 [Henneguya salminicola]|nr:hypothetical protein HZS_519 [Henneguya salminicola]